MYMSARVGLSLFVLDVTAVLLILFGFLAAITRLYLPRNILPRSAWPSPSHAVNTGTHSPRLR